MILYMHLAIDKIIDQQITPPLAVKEKKINPFSYVLCIWVD